jgi:hypothetical protein
MGCKNLKGDAAHQNGSRETIGSYHLDGKITGSLHSSEVLISSTYRKVKLSP